MQEPMMINGKVPDPEARARLLAVTDSGLECSDEDAIPEVKITITETTPPITSSKHSLKLKSKRQSIKDSLKSGNWKLKYRDFIPSHSGKQERWNTPTGNFSKLIDNANEWLRKNSQVRVKLCETMAWSSSEPEHLADNSQMVISRNTKENSQTFYKRGLRIWLEPRYNRFNSQTLCSMDFSPDKKNNTVNSLVEKINQKITNKHIKGRIVTIETVSQPWQGSQKLDTKSTKWAEPTNDDVQYAFFLRVFYVKDGGNDKLDQFSTIGLKDIIPLERDSGYEAFECLVGRANEFLKSQNNLQVINLQSVIVKMNQDDIQDHPTGSNCYFTMPGLNAVTPVDFFRILRISYIIIIPSSNTTDVSPSFPFHYETFTPEIIKEKDSGPERLETMAETFSKVIAFLRNTGADVLGAEMVHYPMQLYSLNNVPSNLDQLNFLYTIRLYLSGQACTYDGNERSIKRGSVVSTSSRRDVGRREGPIFLRSVVNRQFKYRWLVLGISVISCMSVIVVVSVVYSNR